MENQKKQLIGILVLLVILIAAFFGIRAYNEAKEEKETEEELAETIQVVDLALDDITAFSYQIAGETLSFRKDGESWIYEQDESIDIDEDVIETMLSYAASVTASDTFEPEVSLDEYGLATPANTIVLMTNDSEVTLALGNYNSLVGSEYLMKDDMIYLVDSTLSTQFSKTVEDLTYVEPETEDTEEESSTEEASDTEESNTEGESGTEEASGTEGESGTEEASGTEEESDTEEANNIEE